HAQSDEAQELLSKLLQDLQSINEELAEFINHPSWNLPTSSYDDDDDEYSFAQKYLMTCSTAVTPDSPVTDSLIMGDEHLDTIPETESDELIKSSVENLVQIPSESEDSSEYEFAGELTFATQFTKELIDVILDPEGEYFCFLEHFALRQLFSPLPSPPKEFNSENPTESFSPSPIPVEDSDSLMEGDCHFS
ncbi:hypothetical protein Tco_0471407, partial [Tanacetum coccineum]